MHKVIFWDKTYVIISDEQVAGVEKNIARGKSFRLKHASGEDFLAPGSIGRITKAGLNDYTPPQSDAPRIAAHEDNDEDRARKRAKIAKMKEDFLKKKDLRNAGH